MRALLVTVIIINLLGVANASKKDYVTIPPHILTETEAEEREARKRDGSYWNEPTWTLYYYDENRRLYTYREEDIQSALRGIIDESDRLFGVCYHPEAGYLDHIRFLGMSSEPNQVTIKIARCGESKMGLSCESSLGMYSKYEYKGAHFDFDASLTEYGDVVEAIEAFDQLGIEGLPKFFEEYDTTAINSVEKTENGYVIGFGSQCGGCFGKVIVAADRNAESRIQQLTHVDTIDALCI